MKTPLHAPPWTRRSGPWPIRRRGLALGAAFAAIFAAAHAAPEAPVGLKREVVFTDYSPLSRNAELVRRLLSPLTAAKVQERLARAGQTLAEQSVDLSREKFVIYIPARPPPGGYGLLVFVPPGEGAELPQGWATVLDLYGLIFVSAARSGNDASILGRRIPLALAAVHNIGRQYAVNPERVYIAGFSGGSRVAMRLALGYPDIFRGALLNAGSDPIGDIETPLPPREVFLRFQQSTRLVYVTGEQDAINLGKDSDSMGSMRHWCVFDVEAQVMLHVGHAAPDPSAFARALGVLLKPAPPNPGRLDACRSTIERDLAAKFQQVEALTAAGKHDDARALLEKIDARFGGLAAPRVVDLAP